MDFMAKESKPNIEEILEACLFSELAGKSLINANLVNPTNQTNISIKKLEDNSYELVLSDSNCGSYEDDCDKKMRNYLQESCFENLAKIFEVEARILLKARGFEQNEENIAEYSTLLNLLIDALSRGPEFLVEFFNYLDAPKITENDFIKTKQTLSKQIEFIYKNGQPTKARKIIKRGDVITPIGLNYEMIEWENVETLEVELDMNSEDTNIEFESLIEIIKKNINNFSGNFVFCPNRILELHEIMIVEVSQQEITTEDLPDSPRNFILDISPPSDAIIFAVEYSLFGGYALQSKEYSGIPKDACLGGFGAVW